MNNFFRTWSFRMTALFAALFAISPTVLFAAIYWVALDYSADDYHEEMETEFKTIMDQARQDDYRTLPLIVDTHLRLHAIRPTVYLLEDAAGKKLAGNIDPMPPKVGPHKIVFPERKIDDDIDAFMFKTPNDQYLLIGEVSEELDVMKDRIIATFVIGGTISIGVGIIFGLLASRTLLGKLRTISGAARSIASGNLLARVPSHGGDDEFEDLSRSINLMLERIEELMRRVRHISSDIAHDLRAPLSLLKQNIEGAKSGAYSPAKLEDVLEQAGGQVDTILSTFEALLKIGQIEADHVESTASVNLSSLLATIVDDFAPAAEDQGKLLIGEIQPDLRIVGEERLVVQLAINLVENALRYTPSATVIRVAARRTSKGQVLRVADNGDGIPVSEFPKITRPFYRLPLHEGAKGNGLGLSLVAAIAEYHGATLDFRDNKPGLLVEVVFRSSQ